MIRPILTFAVALALLAGCQSRSSSRIDEERGSTSEAVSASFDPEMAAICQQACAARIPYEEADLSPQPGATHGNLTRCIVSGVVFVVANDNPKVEHAGNSYYLCCDGCARKFREKPERFARS